MNRNILVVDDEEIQAGIIADILEKEDYPTERVFSAEEALHKVEKKQYAVILIDLKMPGLGGMGFLDRVGGPDFATRLIIMTAYGTIETAVEAMKKGAFNYITKPFSREELVINVERAVNAFHLADENRSLKETLSGFYQDQEFVGTSRAVKRIHELITKVARNDSVNVLITGESGTGKELVARAIHRNSGRSEYPFVPVNCSAIPENLMESELFGYVKGAFTGAEGNREGKFKKAMDGTLFLDEIADMPLNMQVKLLRVIQDGEVTPVGGDDPFKVNVRVIAATNRNLEKMVKEGSFRDDLYYRLNVVPIAVPPLRERREDISYLVQHIIQKLNRKLNKSVQQLPDEIMKAMMQYPFPGNVRELENMLERGFILSEGNKIDPGTLPTLGESEPGKNGESRNLKSVSRKARRKAEREVVIEALNKTSWNRVRAAHILGVDYKTLRNKIKELHIEPEYLHKGERDE